MFLVSGQGEPRSVYSVLNCCEYIMLPLFLLTDHYSIWPVWAGHDAVVVFGARTRPAVCSLHLNRFRTVGRWNAVIRVSPIRIRTPFRRSSSGKVRPGVTTGSRRVCVCL